MSHYFTRNIIRKTLVALIRRPYISWVAIACLLFISASGCSKKSTKATREEKMLESVVTAGPSNEVKIICSEGQNNGASLQISAIKPFKINREYPISGNISYKNATGTNETRPLSDAQLSEQGETVRVLKFAPDSSIFKDGLVKSLSVDVKFGVCTDSICKIEQATKRCP